MSVAIYKNGKVVPVAGNADTSLTADNITEILGYTPADSSVVSSLTVSLEDKVDKVEGKGLSTNDLTDELKTSYDDAVELVNKLGADATVEGSVAQRLAAIVANAPEKYDTLKEIATWIESDTDGAAKMQADIATLEADKLNKTDIATWAKASTKPAYTASEINMTNGANVESAIATLNSNLSSVWIDLNNVSVFDYFSPIGGNGLHSIWRSLDAPEGMQYFNIIKMTEKMIAITNDFHIYLTISQGSVWQRNWVLLI